MTDIELVQRALENPDDFFCLMKRYEEKLLQYVKRLSDLSPEETEDLVQEVFIKVYRNLHGFDQKLKFSSWIYRIAHNVVIDHVRKKKVWSTVWLPMGDSLKSLRSSREDPGKFVTAEMDLQSRQERKNLEKALLDLPLKYREVLILRYFEEKSYEEMSDILRKPPGTVATLLNRAKKRLKKIAQKYGLEEIEEL